MDYNVFTKNEVDLLLAEIEDLERNKFCPGRRLAFSPELSRLAQGQGLASVKKALAELVVLDLTVAVKLSPAFLAKIGRWLREEINQKVILDIKVDPSIIAGAIVSYGGKYRDLSAGRGLEEWFTRESTRIQTLINEDR
ncbi:hypothetical protein COT64_01590 [Candidatus Shapirobacteria bacterium CG09_land_8_20_14_0_10_39_12]|uniref:Uncharacterized protein n=1 Tax=Candidatus Shapirobacteria bacterium CG09_land_8_20_14_0_10_39_12 TaxID=1974885 RepID=A0A2H0WPR4_9BACT|nr:MAG: hypothetical protein COT64_01590 [Candidatus Shapirobacteria bacterium CG09_land_8_20_14_0_10_39_12]